MNNLVQFTHVDAQIMKIALGTKSNYKIHAVKKVLHELEIECEIDTIDAASGISEQPRNAGETKLGSVNRARNSIEKISASDIGIGVEFGYEPIDGKYHMVCWASIIDQDGIVYSEQSSTLELPKVLLETLDSDNEVGENLHKILDKLDDTPITSEFHKYIHKRLVIYECVRNVFVRYVLREHY